MNMFLIRSSSLSQKLFQLQIDTLLRHVNHFEPSIPIASHAVRLMHVGFLHIAVALYHLQEKRCW